MSVKSAREYSRRALEDLYVEKTMLLDEESRKRQFRAQAVLMKDRDLEVAVTRLNDELNGGEGFDSYYIVDN